MKKLGIIVFFLLFADNTQALVSNNYSLTLSEQKAFVEILNDGVSVQLVQKWKNTSSNDEALELWEPLRGTTTDVHFFVESEGRNFEILEGSERLVPLADAAEKNKNATFFRFGADRWSRLFHAVTTIPAEQEIQTKILFTVSPDFITDFFFLELPLFSETKASELSFHLESERPIYHFFSNVLQSAQYTTGTTQRTIYLQEQNGDPRNYFFFWSFEQQPTLEFPSQNFTYTALFPSEFPSRTEEQMVFLIDGSGSLSGESWKRIQNWLRFLLEHIGEEKEIQIGFLGEEVLWFEKNEFQQNDFEFRKRFFQFLPSVKPIGVSDMTQLQDIRKQEGLVFFFSDGVLEENLWQVRQESPLILFTFGENSYRLFEPWTGGFVQKLFRSAIGLVEKDEFLEKWNTWRRTLSQDFLSPIKENIRDILPHLFPSLPEKESFFFIGRKEGPTDTFSHVAEFLPRMWAERQIAEILKRSYFSEEGASNTVADDLLALGRSFGVETKYIQHDTRRKELIERLKSMSERDIWNEAFRLETPFVSEENHADVYFAQSVPFYQEEGVWRQFDFYDRADADTLIRISPFSPAQKDLFLRFPEFVSESFGAGTEVDFCTKFRCVSVRSGAREEINAFDRILFNAFGADHWAREYLVRGVREGLFEPGERGDMEPEKEISRGIFAQLIFDYFFSEGLPNQKKSEETFSDIPEETSALYEAVWVLAGKGIISGYQDETFRPEQYVTRSEAVKMILALTGFAPPSGIQESKFPDVSGWAIPWIEEAVKRGIVSGFSDGTFRPNQKLTRAEALKFIFSVER